MFEKISNKKLKLITYVIFGFIFIMIMFGVINVYKSCKIIRRQSNINFVSLIKEIQESENDYFSSIESEVQDCKKFIELTLDKTKINKIAPIAFRYDSQNIPYVSQYIDKTVSPLLLYKSNNIKQLLSIYFNFTPDFFNHKKLIGSWFVYSKNTKKFEYADSGFASELLPENDKNLQWYYLPKKFKKGLWIDSYIDKDLKLGMFSYSIPFYLDNKFAGILGIDIAVDKSNYFSKHLDIQDIYRSGKIHLTDGKNKILFSKTYEMMTDIKVLDENVYEYLNNKKTSVKNIRVRRNISLINSSGKLFAIARLYNGWALIAEVSEKELYHDLNKLITFAAYSLILAILTCILISIEAYQRVQKINEELIHKEKLISMGTMAAEVAHEINNPLSYIRCNLDTLKKFFDKLKIFLESNEQARYNVFTEKTEMKSEISKLNKLREELKIDYVIDSINEIIDESREGIQIVSKTVIGLKNFTKDNGKDIKSKEKLDRITEKSLTILRNKMVGIKIIKQFEEIPPIDCYKTKIEQVLINLIDNACYSVREKNLTEKFIKISIYKKENAAYIEVEDNGLGIDKKNINKIFDSFFTTKDYGHGTGLGLSIAYEIITRVHNGEFFVQSKKGKGTIFTIKIPY